MKEYFEKLIERKKKKFKELQERAQNSNDVAEVRSIGQTLVALRDEINDAEEQLKKLENDNGDGNSNSTDKVIMVIMVMNHLIHAHI